MESRLSVDQLINYAINYANNVTFWTDNSRNILRQFCKLILLRIKHNKTPKNRFCWVKSWRMNRIHRGSFAFIRQLEDEDISCYKNYLRMSDVEFETVLDLIRDDIVKKDTNWRKAISPREQLAVTLRFLATGESYRSLNYQSRISSAYLHACIPRVCKAIWRRMKDLYLKFPDCHEEWERIALEFESKWHFPLCVGALDGKHINFYASNKDGSYYHNYKGTDSIVLLALVDANYRFLYIDVGANGRSNDGGVLNHSTLQNILDAGDSVFPPDKIIGRNRSLPYVIVADSAFALQKHLLKPYCFRTTDSARKIFNKRLSRARQTVECSFGALTTRFRVLKHAMTLRKVSNVQIVTQACCVLHNFLSGSASDYETMDSLDESSELQTFSNDASASSHRSVEIREIFKEYFNDEGKVDWISDNYL